MVDMNVHSKDGEKIGQIQLSDDLFNGAINKHIVHQIVKRYLAEKRRGTASTKEKGEVSGGGKKPWRQKGTGRARAGSNRSPLWVGGGVIFGPEPRDYGYSIPKKMRLVALKSVLSDKAKEDNIIILDKLEIENGKTKDIIHMLDNLHIVNDKVLIVIDKEDEMIKRAVRNLQKALVITANKINVYDVLNYQKVIITKNALQIIEEVFAK
ncbi:MAG: 50S ribosomal protein L4 [Candidatus Atribacteria bacterium]|nr:50S ribosomal protein L4 [Candidatus Atribacteria bacterium]